MEKEIATAENAMALINDKILLPFRKLKLVPNSFLEFFENFSKKFNLDPESELLKLHNHISEAILNRNNIHKLKTILSYYYIDENNYLDSENYNQFFRIINNYSAKNDDFYKLYLASICQFLVILLEAQGVKEYFQINNEKNDYSELMCLKTDIAVYIIEFLKIYFSNKNITKEETELLNNLIQEITEKLKISNTYEKNIFEYVVNKTPLLK